MNQNGRGGAKSHDSGGVGREYYPCRFGKTNDTRRVAGNSLGWWNARASIYGCEGKAKIKWAGERYF